MRLSRLSSRLTLLLLLLVASAVSAARQADNVIIFIGDGMGSNHIALTQRVNGKPMAMQQMSVRGTVTTVNVKGKVTDSAAAATALSTGFKTENGKLATAPDGRRLETILERCQKLGKSTGLVTTDQLTGATPAAFIAHVASRHDAEKIVDQMLESGIQVMISAGNGKAYAQQLAPLRKAGYRTATTSNELKKASGNKLIGIFNDETGDPVPTVAERTQAALTRLSKNPKGFFLMVEHAKIDWEPGDPGAILADMRQLDEAVAVALAFAKKRGRTLVLVTGDHETGGLKITNPKQTAFLRPIKLAGWEVAGHLDEKRTNVAQVMAQYAGVKDLTSQEISQVQHAAGEDIQWVIGGIIGSIISSRSGIAWTSDGNHTATPVRIFAYGPGAQRFAGRLDNTDIPKRVALALGIKAFPAPASKAQAGQLNLAFAR